MGCGGSVPVSPVTAAVKPEKRQSAGVIETTDPTVFLSTSSFQRIMSAAELDTFKAYFKTIVFPPRSQIYRQGEAVDSVYLIGRGKVSIYLESSESEQPAMISDEKHGHGHERRPTATLTVTPSAKTNRQHSSRSSRVTTSKDLPQSAKALCEKEAGELFGEELIVGDAMRVSSARVTSDAECTCVFLDKPAFERCSICVIALFYLCCCVV